VLNVEDGNRNILKKGREYEFNNRKFYLNENLSVALVEGTFDELIEMLKEYDIDSRYLSAYIRLEEKEKGNSEEVLSEMDVNINSLKKANLESNDIDMKNEDIVWEDVEKNEDIVWEDVEKNEDINEVRKDDKIEDINEDINEDRKDDKSMDNISHKSDYNYFI
jgi:hypothetical protein